MIVLAIMVSEFLDNNSRLKDVTYRLAIQMDKKKGYAYWVESASGSVKILSVKARKNLSELTSDQRKLQEARNHFTLAKSITKKPVQLPGGLKFLEVEYADGHLHIRRGVAYIHYFPQGLAQEAAIHIGNGKTLNWTLAIRPLTGQVDILPKNTPLSELDQ